MDNVETFAETVKRLSCCNYHITRGGLVSLKKNDTLTRRKMGTLGWLTHRKKFDDYKFEVRKDLAVKASVDDMFDYEVENLVYNSPGLRMYIDSGSEVDVKKVVKIIKRLLLLV